MAAIHDLSGFGRASLTVVIPILASMGVQTCPLPTAVLSSQTSGVEGFTFHDLTAEMGPMLDHWQRMGLSFDAVYSGFLGNPLQLEIAARCIGHFLKPGGFALVDPVLGDNGTLDPTQTPEMVEAMRQLIGHAHVITPNLTEAAFLLDEPYRPDISPDGLKEQLRRLAAMGPDRVVITSAPATRPGHCAAGRGLTRGRGASKMNELTSGLFLSSARGDTFSSVLVGAFLQGTPRSSLSAVRFRPGIHGVTYGYDTRHSDGVLLERTLPALQDRCAIGEYEAFCGQAPYGYAANTKCPLLFLYSFLKFDYPAQYDSPVRSGRLTTTTFREPMITGAVKNKVDKIWLDIFPRVWPTRSPLLNSLPTSCSSARWMSKSWKTKDTKPSA